MRATTLSGSAFLSPARKKNPTKNRDGSKAMTGIQAEEDHLSRAKTSSSTLTASMGMKYRPKNPARGKIPGSISTDT